MRNIANDLILKGRINTTEARAKEIRSIVERSVTISKKGTLSARRLLIARLHNPRAVGKLMDDLGSRYRSRNGGYVRIVKSGKARKRDGVRTATIEFV